MGPAWQRSFKSWQGWDWHGAIEGRPFGHRVQAGAPQVKGPGVSVVRASGGLGWLGMQRGGGWKKGAAGAEVSETSQAGLCKLC